MIFHRHRVLLVITPSLYFYKAHTQMKISILQSLTNNFRINFLFFSVNLIWWDLSSNILSNDYMFIIIKNII
jgi:succinate dehydrogenase/fumarate reductase cytochrome b subunit